MKSTRRVMPPRLHTKYNEHTKEEVVEMSEREKLQERYILNMLKKHSKALDEVQPNE